MYRRELGATTTEYLILVSVLTVGLISVIVAFGTRISNALKADGDVISSLSGEDLLASADELRPDMADGSQEVAEQGLAEEQPASEDERLREWIEGGISGENQVKTEPLDRGIIGGVLHKAASWLFGTSDQPANNWRHLRDHNHERAIELFKEAKAALDRGDREAARELSRKAGKFNMLGNSANSEACGWEAEEADIHVHAWKDVIVEPIIKTGKIVNSFNPEPASRTFFNEAFSGIQLFVDWQVEGRDQALINYGVDHAVDALFKLPVGGSSADDLLEEGIKEGIPEVIPEQLRDGATRIIKGKVKEIPKKEIEDQVNGDDDD